MAVAAAHKISLSYTDAEFRGHMRAIGGLSLLLASVPTLWTKQIKFSKFQAQFFLERTEASGVEDVAHLVQCVLSMHEALGSIHSAG